MIRTRQDVEKFLFCLYSNMHRFTILLPSMKAFYSALSLLLPNVTHTRVILFFSPLFIPFQSSQEVRRPLTHPFKDTGNGVLCLFYEEGIFFSWMEDLKAQQKNKSLYLLNLTELFFFYLFLFME